MAKVYDKNLKRRKFNEYTNLIVDKSIVKDGYTLKIGNKYYVKVGKRLAELTLQNPLWWDEVKQENILMVCKPNGQTLMERIEDE